MDPIRLPPLPGGKRYRETADAELFAASDADRAAFDAYVSALTAAGFLDRERRERDGNVYASFSSGDTGVFVNYFEKTRELRAVCEQNCRYFAFSDRGGERRGPERIAQIPLRDFGESYAVRLGDGRFLLFDGGFYEDGDAEALADYLRAAADGRPVIAAWIVTHPHHDHFGGALRFLEHFGGEATVEKFLFNMPETPDEAYSWQFSRDWYGLNYGELLLRFLAAVRQTGAPVFVPHTGQLYRFGDVTCEILSSPDDTAGVPSLTGKPGVWSNLNYCSLVIRMRIAGQTVLWCADAQLPACRLAERYGAYLKADVLQAPHHGFVGGDADCFDLIAPEVCLLAQSDAEFFSCSGAFRPEWRHLVEMPCLREMISGDGPREITLPYHAHPNGRRELDERFLAGQQSCGARSWFFTGLRTATDCKVEVIVASRIAPELRLELIFDDPAAYDGVRVETVKRSINRFDLASLFDLPETDMPFALRVFADAPVVVSVPGHTPAYHS